MYVSYLDTHAVDETQFVEHLKKYAAVNGPAVFRVDPINRAVAHLTFFTAGKPFAESCGTQDLTGRWVPSEPFMICAPETPLLVPEFLPLPEKNTPKDDTGSNPTPSARTGCDE